MACSIMRKFFAISYSHGGYVRNLPLPTDPLDKSFWPSLPTSGHGWIRCVWQQERAEGGRGGRGDERGEEGREEVEGKETEGEGRGGGKGSEAQVGWHPRHHRQLYGSNTLGGDLYQVARPIASVTWSASRPPHSRPQSGAALHGASPAAHGVANRRRPASS